MNPVILSATGNVFAIVDGFREAWPEKPAEAARELCEADPRIHGLFLLAPPRRGGTCRSVLYNADGSRAELSGNGLRCVARFLHDQGHSSEECMQVETDVGLRGVRILRRDGDNYEAEVDLGVPQVVAARKVLEVGKECVEACHVVVGNPHLVIFFDEVRRAPIKRLGRALQNHPEFPRGINIGFAAPAKNVIQLRTWERGVGETPACGTNAAAASVAALQLGLVAGPVRVEMSGGVLGVDWARFGPVRVRGAVEVLTEESSPRDELQPRGSAAKTPASTSEAEPRTPEEPASSSSS